MIVAFIALAIALQGSAIARVLIGSANIKNNAITSAKIKNRTIKSKDIARGVIPDPYSKTQSDARYVNKLPGTLNEAPNSAALGGTAADQFLTKGQSDSRYVNIVPGTINAAPNSAALGGIDAADYMQAHDGLSRITRLALTPAATPPRTTLLALPNIGSFQVACDSGSTAAELYLVKEAGASEVDLISERTYDPAGGGTGDTTDTLATLALTGDEHQFASVTGATSVARYVVQLSRNTTTKHWVATATISLTYNDDNVGPGKCFALGQFTEASEAG